MELDPVASSSADSTSFTMSQTALPKIDEGGTFELKPPKQRLMEVLDLLEGHVEKFRKEASKLEEDRDSLLASLDSVRNADMMVELIESECEDIHRYADRVTSRCLTVEVKIHTKRDQTQEEALHQVNLFIDNLVMGLKVDPDSTKARCISYMNACSSHFVKGVTDKNFESALLGCTVDDQKRVKKRLQGLLNYFGKLDRLTQVDYS